MITVTMPIEEYEELKSQSNVGIDDEKFVELRKAMEEVDANYRLIDGRCMGDPIGGEVGQLFISGDPKIMNKIRLLLSVEIDFKGMR